VETLVLYKAAEKSVLDRFEPTGIFFLTVVGIVLSSQQVGKKQKKALPNVVTAEWKRESARSTS
jgi:hypothetical protein